MFHIIFPQNYISFLEFADVDECVTNPDICGTGGTCTDTDGSYTCACAAGYTGGGAANPCTGKL